MRAIFAGVTDSTAAPKRRVRLVLTSTKTSTLNRTKHNQIYFTHPCPVIALYQAISFVFQIFSAQGFSTSTQKVPAVHEPLPGISPDSAIVPANSISCRASDKLVSLIKGKSISENRSKSSMSSIRLSIRSLN